MKNIIKIPTIVGVLFLVAGLAAGIILIQNTSIFRSGASPQAAPRNVRISNISDSSFTVTWQTDSQTFGFIKFGEGENLSQTAQDDIEKSTVHSATAKNLKPQIKYSFKVNSQGSDFDSNGMPWAVSTGPALGKPEATIIMSGQVNQTSGAPAPQALVFATVPGGSPLSTVTSQNGSWLINLAEARASTLSTYASIDTKTSVIEILVQGNTGTATAKITPEAGRYTPAITLGTTQDFTNTLPGGAEIPGTQLSLPNNIPTPQSKFNVEESSATATQETVTLDSVNEGETVTTLTPEFFGEGPPGTELTITIESDPITQTVNVGNSGSWQWSTPQNLEPGEHKVTVAWRDALGILRTFTRSFVVSAAEGPAFEASASANLTPTPSASPTLAPSTNSTASPLATPTATASVVPIPVSGTLTPTIALFIMSVGLAIAAAAIAYFVF